MRSISISKRKFDNLQVYNTSDVNTEGVMYDFSYHGSVKLLKKLYVSDGVSFAQKLYILECLNSMTLPDSFIVPDSLVTINNNVVGFTVPKIDGVTLKQMLDNHDFPFDVKIRFLKEVGSILDSMVGIRNNTDFRHFYLNDIHESNFMVNYATNSLCAIDLDGCKINPSFSFPSRYLTSGALLNYSDKYNVEPNLKHGAYVMANYDSEIYCYIIMILNYLYGSNVNNMELGEFYNYLNYLDNIGVNRDLLNCFNMIVSNGKNIDPTEYLDSLNSEILCRSKKLVYDIVRKK